MCVCVKERESSHGEGGGQDIGTSPRHVHRPHHHPQLLPLKPFSDRSNISPWKLFLFGVLRGDEGCKGVAKGRGKGGRGGGGVGGGRDGESEGEEEALVNTKNRCEDILDDRVDAWG